MRKRAPHTAGDGGSSALSRSIHSAGSSAPLRVPKSSDSQSLTASLAETSGGTSARTTKGNLPWNEWVTPTRGAKLSFWVYSKPAGVPPCPPIKMYGTPSFQVRLLPCLDRKSVV